MPSLLKVRLDSHILVTQAQGQLLSTAFPDVPQKDLLLVGRVAVDMVYAGVEMLFDVPLNQRSVAQVIAGMVASHLSKLRSASVSVR